MSVDELMAIAVGSMGMSLADFCAMTPHEFSLLQRSWHRTHVEEPWERTRLLACYILQPWSKKKLTPEQLMRFSWDKKQTASARPATEQSTRQRFEELVKRCGG